LFLHRDARRVFTEGHRVLRGKITQGFAEEQRFVERKKGSGREKEGKVQKF
jgi:hypothetical protein